jgi:hypothetical protein
MIILTQCATLVGYTYKDRNSDAHIDIDLDARLDTEGEFSYFVTIFGWAATEDSHAVDPRS